jgi:hypothetical protein
MQKWISGTAAIRISYSTLISYKTLGNLAFCIQNNSIE